MRFLNFRSTVFALAALVAGILFGYCLKFGYVVWAVVSGVSGVAVLIVFVFFSSLKVKNASKFLCVAVFILCAVFGYVRFSSDVNNYEKTSLGGHVLTVSGRIDEITEYDGYTYVVVSDVSVSGAINGKSYYKTAVTVNGETELKLGDIVKFSAAVYDRTAFYDGRFSASAIAERIKFSAEVSASEISVITHCPTVFQDCNLFIFNALKAGLSDEIFPIAYAMLTGNSDYIAEEVISAYRSAGVAHVFAVSGLHVGFLATAVYFILNKLKLQRHVAFSVTLAACFFYSGICGFSASSLRAVIMFFFLNLSRLFGFKYDGISSVAAAAFLILIFSPAQLFCVGFLLSFSVVASIIILYDPIKKLLKFIPDKISSAIAVSLSAELGGIPVLLYAFGEFAPLSLFVNILFVPVIGVIFIALISCTVLGEIFAPSVFLFLPGYALFGINYAVTALDFKALLVGGFTFGAFTIFYYGTFIVAAGIFNFRKILKAILSIMLAITCVAGTWAANVADNKRVYATVIGSPSVSAVLFHGDSQNFLVISDINYKTFSQYRLLKAVKRARAEDISVVLLNTGTEADVQVLLHRLLYVANVKALYYYGERNETAEYVIGETYDRVFVTAMGEGDGTAAFGGRWSFGLDGRCFALTVNGRNTAVFASFENGGGYTGLNGRVDNTVLDTVICLDKQDGITRAYSPLTAVSFRPYGKYKDGESRGNLLLTIG